MPGAGEKILLVTQTLLPCLLASQHDEVERAVTEPIALNAILLVLGIATVATSRRFPYFLAVSSSMALGARVALLLLDWQADPPTDWLHVPQGAWAPIAGGAAVAVLACVLAWCVLAAALTLLTASLVTLCALSILRLANVSPGEAAEAGETFFSNYRIASILVFGVSIVAAALLVKRVQKPMCTFAAASLGTLLLVSSVSFFVQRVRGNEMPDTLLDKLPRAYCDCDAGCKVEVIAWAVLSLAAIVAQQLCCRVHHGRERSLLAH